MSRTETGMQKLIDRRNFNYRGNQPFKPKNFSMPNVNSEPSKNGVNAVSGDRKPEWVAQKPVASQIRCFQWKMPSHKRSECPRLQPRSNNCARVGLESQRITGNQFAISLYVNGKLVDGHRDSGADISLASRKIVRKWIISQMRVWKSKVYRADFAKSPWRKFVWNLPDAARMKTLK